MTHIHMFLSESSTMMMQTKGRSCCMVMAHVSLTAAIAIHSLEAFSPPHQIHSSRIPPPYPVCVRPVLHLQGNDYSQADSTRRRRTLEGLLVGFSGLIGIAQPGHAIITDETDSFANTARDSSYRGLTTTTAQQPPINSDNRAIRNSRSNNIPQSEVPTSDEITISIPKKDLSKGLGIELGEVKLQTAMRVYVKSIDPGSVADRLGIQKDWIIVSVNGQSVERTNGEGVAIVVYRANQSTPDNGTIQLVFRDPAVFQQRLKAMSSTTATNDFESATVTTQIAPEGDTNTNFNLDGTLQSTPGVNTIQSDQRLTVSQLIPPKVCTRGATTGDLLEIAYLGTVVETGSTFDGSAIRINGEGIPGRGNDVSLFFVLGKQPMGQFPPGWDVGLEGMCVGERRRLIIPPVLAYGATGVPRRGIPPNASLRYDISLVSINGLATPQ